MVLDLSLPDASGLSLLETLASRGTYSFPRNCLQRTRIVCAGRRPPAAVLIIIKSGRSPERLLDEV